MARRGKRAEEDVENEAEETPYASRSDRTRAINAVNKIGLRLAAFRPATLDKLDLPEELRHERSTEGRAACFDMAAFEIFAIVRRQARAIKGDIV